MCSRLRLGHNTELNWGHNRPLTYSYNFGRVTSKRVKCNLRLKSAYNSKNNPSIHVRSDFFLIQSIFTIVSKMMDLRMNSLWPCSLFQLCFKISPWARGPKVGHRYQKGSLNLLQTLLFRLIMHLVSNPPPTFGITFHFLATLNFFYCPLVPPFSTEKWSGSQTRWGLTALHVWQGLVPLALLIENALNE